MKRLLTPLCMLFFFVASAQVTKDDVNYVQAVYGKNKRDLMQEYLTFKNKSKADAFWKLYDSYEAERKKLGQNTVSILQDYAKNYEQLTDKKADEIMMKVNANNIAFENLYMKYYQKMKPVVGALTASQFIQLESYLRSVIRTSVLEEIPFIGQIDSTRKASQ